jgi:outer membrane lipoprotein-sorting protein
MLKYILILSLLSTYTGIFSQNAAEPLVQDAMAEPYLDKLAALFSTSKAFQVEFRYEIISNIEKTKVSDFGSVILKGNKYKMKTDDAVIYYNGIKLWSFNPVTQEVYLSEPGSNETEGMLTDPFRLMENYKQFYKYRFKGEKKIDGRNYTEIDLYPKNLNTDYSILRILFDAALNKPYAFTLKQKNGYDVVVYVNDIIKNLKIDDAAFEWNQSEYPDALLIEM